ncbi:MAG TPA: hypothetical protein VJB87_00460 [Candidatus Nanoarchaeia archaeon]|nr:hypothetical protein [Candidatus Nanoarchaeia archaeon]
MKNTFKFTTHPGNIEKEVQRKAKIVTNIIAQELQPLSILMFGSFGKGEGTILNKKELFNDFDMYIITEEKVPDAELDRVAKKASAAIGMGGGEFIESDGGKNYNRKQYFHVDLRALQHKELPRLKKTTRTYEIKYATQLLYGKDYRHLITIKAEELPLSEGWRHFINKSCLLLLAMDNQRRKGKFHNDEKLIANYYSIKTYLGCAEALLLLKKHFSGYYQGRNKLFQKIYGKELPALAEKVNWATNMKCDFQPRKIKNTVKLWKEARDTLYFTITYLAEHALGITAKNKKELMRKIYKKLAYTYHGPYIPLIKHAGFPLQYGLNLLYAQRTKYYPTLLNWRDPGFRIWMPAFLLLYAHEEPELLEEAKKYLQQLAPITTNDFEGLRTATLYCYGKYYTQRLL